MEPYASMDITTIMDLEALPDHGYLLYGIQTWKQQF
jgi:hypothetical protein